MTYMEYLRSTWKPERDDFGFIVAGIAATFTIGLLIAIPLCFGYGNLMPLLSLLAIFGGMYGAVVVVFFVGTATYWAIVKR